MLLFIAKSINIFTRNYSSIFILSKLDVIFTGSSVETNFGFEERTKISRPTQNRVNTENDAGYYHFEVICCMHGAVLYKNLPHFYGALLYQTLINHQVYFQKVWCWNLTKNYIHSQALLIDTARQRQKSFDCAWRKNTIHYDFAQMIS